MEKFLRSLNSSILRYTILYIYIFFASQFIFWICWLSKWNLSSVCWTSCISIVTDMRSVIKRNSGAAKTGNMNMRYIIYKQLIVYRLNRFSWQGTYISTEDIFVSRQVYTRSETRCFHEAKSFHGNVAV